MATKGEKPRADASSESAGSRSGSGHEVGRFPGSPAGVEEGSPKRCVSEGSLDVDLERGLSEIDEKRGAEKPDKGKPSKAAERDCRICHLGLESASPESGLAIELGCSCKDDLGAAHRQCAETWFKIRGNKTCEICGTIARNVVGSGETEFIEQWNESNNATATPASTTEARPFWLNLENFGGVFPSLNNHHHWLEKASIDNQAPQSTAEASFSLIVLTER